jgi:hypothetical protein
VAISRKPCPLVLSEAESQQLAHIVERGSELREAFSVKVSTWVVQQALSREGNARKRTRHSLKKKDATPLLAVPSLKSRNSKSKPSKES